MFLKHSRGSWTGTAVATIIFATLAGFSSKTADAAPIVINCVQQLDEIGVDPSMPLSGNYTLNSNIDASGFAFTPIGVGAVPFTGVFDGNGHTINNLAINAPGTFDGLFGYIGAGGVVENVGLTNAAVTNTTGFGVGNRTGGLAGENDGQISNSYMVGSINTSGSLTSWSGGLTGINEGTITQSHAIVADSALNITYNNTGGLAGSNSGTIQQSFALGSVDASRAPANNGFVQAGGLVGYNQGSVAQSYATSSVVGSLGQGAIAYYGDISVGGLVGNNQGAVNQSYANGLVASEFTAYSGGLVGVTQNTSTITQSYATGSVIGGNPGSNPPGGLVGYDATCCVGTGTFLNNYWDKQTTGQSNDGLPTGSMGALTAYLTSGSLPGGFDMAVWTATPDHYPSLLANPPSPPPPTLLQLAQASNDVYSGNSAPNADGVSGVYTYKYDSCSPYCGLTGFRGAAYLSADGTHVIVAIRGTDLGDPVAALKNLAEDTSFQTGMPDIGFRNDFAAAMRFLNRVKTDYGNADITLTGDSLGGALAQLLGISSGFATDVFSAPGAARLESNLGVVPVSAGRSNIDYRIDGDQWSLFGKEIGNTITIASDISPLVDPFGLIFQDHLIDTVISQIDAAKTLGRSGNDITPELTAIATGIVVAHPDLLIFHLLVDAFRSVAFDPSAGADFIFAGDSNSPNFACLDLPLLSGVVSYDLRTKTGTAWSLPTVVPAAANTCFGTGIDAIEFEPLDAIGNAFDISGAFLFEASFVTDGEFTGTLLEVTQSAPEPSTLGLLVAPLLVSVLAMRGCRKRGRSLSHMPTANATERSSEVTCRRNKSI